MPHAKPKLENPYKKQLEELVRQREEDDDLSTEGLEEKIKKLMEFFDFHGIDYGKYTPQKFPSFDSKGYPNYDQYMYIPGKHDTSKWLKAVKEIHYKQRAGFKFGEAVRTVTQGWKKMEVYDFLNWLKFYEEGTHMKYKFAQVWYENGQPGYFLHIKPDEKAPPEPVVDGTAVDNAQADAERTEERKQTIEKQRQKIIGRLDSAEKLLRSPEGQMFAGDELENLMEAIYTLKKKVQLVNKISVSTRLYEDMIVREANVLSRRGFVKAAEMLYSVAEDPLPPAAPPQDPSGAGGPGTPGTLPAEIGTPNVQTPVNNDQNSGQPPASAIKGAPGPEETAVSSPAIMPKKEKPKGISDFIRAMNEGKDTDTDVTVADDDNLEVEDSEEPLMVTEAQLRGPIDEPMTTTPPPAPENPVAPPVAVEEPKAPKAPRAPGAPAAEEPLEVTEDDIPSTPSSDFSNQIDQLMQNVTIADVVAELEDISKDYKTRSQPRRLGKVDMMLDSLGLASMFPSLSEAQNKALEANNYISTRVDDILAKLRGAMASAEKPASPTPERPEVAGIKSKLQSDQDKETKRKQMRKEQEAAELEGGAGKETPEVEMGELGAPAAPAAPPVPPAAPPRAPAV